MPAKPAGDVMVLVRVSLLVVVATFLQLACGSRLHGPDLREIYDRVARTHQPDRNPIIVIPGVLGSKLVDSRTGKTVWGAFSGSYANPNTPEGARLLALPMREGAPLCELQNSVVPVAVLDRLEVNLFGLPLALEAYGYMLRAIGVGGYRDEDLGLLGPVDYGDEHVTCFQFPYDFRRDNVENARLLHEFILEKQAYIQDEYERRFGSFARPVKFDIVAHSMGGLIARYYLRYGPRVLPLDGSAPQVTWEGGKYVERLILVGTPNAGSLESLLELIEGLDLGWFLPSYEAALIGTMPSVYQVLPRSRHRTTVDAADPTRTLDILDPRLWREMRWGLADPEQDAMLSVLLPDVPDAASRRRIALEHLEKCLRRARHFQEALDLAASPPPGLDVYLIAGDATPTSTVLAVERQTGTISVAARSPGDGVVSRASALMDERLGGEWRPRLVSPVSWKQVLFLSDDHVGMMQDPAFTDNLLYLLLEDPRVPESSRPDDDRT